MPADPARYVPVARPVSTGASSEALHRAVSAARFAPSADNAQPWRWQLSDGCLDLFVETRRMADAGEPDERLAAIACGAALQLARLVLASTGWRVTVTRQPTVPSHTTSPGCTSMRRPESANGPSARRGRSSSGTPINVRSPANRCGRRTSPRWPKRSSPREATCTYLVRSRSCGSSSGQPPPTTSMLSRPSGMTNSRGGPAAVGRSERAKTCRCPGNWAYANGP